MAAAAAVAAAAEAEARKTDFCGVTEALAAVKEDEGADAGAGATESKAEEGIAVTAEPLPKAPVLRTLARLLAACRDVVPWSLGDRSGVGLVAKLPAAVGEEAIKLHALYGEFMKEAHLDHEGTMLLPMTSDADPTKTDDEHRLAVQMTSGSQTVFNAWLAELGVAPITTRITKSAYAEDAPRVRDTASGGAGSGVHLPVVA